MMSNQRSMLGLIAAVVTFFVILVLLIYAKSDGPGRIAIETEVAKLLVQATSIIIVGALVKYAIQEMTASRDREIELREKKKSILQSIRHVHHIVWTVPFLIEQERTIGCYQQNMSRLTDALKQLKDVSDDIQSMGLANIRDEVREKHLGGMINYVKEIVLEGVCRQPKDWSQIVELPLYSNYRAEVLKIEKRTDFTCFTVNYDQNYESLKDLIRSALGLHLTIDEKTQYKAKSETGA